jgi:hypothetical protein
VGGGQRWPPLDVLATEGHANHLVELEPGLWHLVTQPATAIGQRALIVPTPRANMMWDCVPCVDDATSQALASMGGLAAIAISHPHLYADRATWSGAFAERYSAFIRGDAPRAAPES